MDQFKFSKKDLEQVAKTGHTMEQIRNQLALFEQGTPYIKLVKPCIVGDGIKKLSNDTISRSIKLYEKMAIKHNLLKFVPASGAATRMFKNLISAYNFINTDNQTHSLENEVFYQNLLHFFNNCGRFAFYDDLKKALATHNLNIKTVIDELNFKPLLRHLLFTNGLHYAGLPKGLIKFHAYPDHNRKISRTAFEEHLIEANGYVKSVKNECAIHFTVAPDHQAKFVSFYQDILNDYESKLDTHFHISFSTQKKETNTIAVDMKNQPYRIAGGSIFFRPGGHGALIENLNQLESDIIFIKNIDNVAHDRFNKEMFKWKKVLCGHLIYLQQNIFHFLKMLHSKTAGPDQVKKIKEFIDMELSIKIPDTYENAAPEKKQKILIDFLNRPIKVCGMVKNVGEPGGGPFWIKNNHGDLSIQIIETSQIDKTDSEQLAILNSLTHFNPVDIVCSIKDWRGKAFNLTEYVDNEAVFISAKSDDGLELKALELPGLWNGAMAFWNTVFVEVPRSTFNPVKEVSDLLQEAHQPC